MVDAGVAPHCSKDEEKFFLIKGEDFGSVGEHVAGVPDGVGVLHLDLCVRKGKAWLRKLWYDGASCEGDSRRYAVAVHNGCFGDPPGSAEDSDRSDVSPVGSSHKKRARCLSSDSDDVPLGGEDATGSECLRRSARRRVPFDDAAADRSSCKDGASRTSIVNAAGLTAAADDDDDEVGGAQIRRSQRLNEKRTQKGSPLAELLIKRRRESVLRQSEEGESDSSAGLAADETSARGKRRSVVGRCAARESDVERSSSDFLVESDELSSSVEGDDEPPPRNPYMPSKEELDESQKPAFMQLRAVTNRNLSQFDSFRQYMKGKLRRACAERSGSVHPPASCTDEESAARKIRDDMIRSMKNNLNSAAWQKEFKHALDTYETYRSEKVPYDGHTCQVCHRKERRATYVIRLSNPVFSSRSSSSGSGTEDEQPKLHLAFFAGRRCANRSQGYHELQHYDKTALSSCRARAKAVAARAGAGAGPRLATPELCLDGDSGEEWLSLEFKMLQSQLQAAEKFMDKENADNDD